MTTNRRGFNIGHPERKEPNDGAPYRKEPNDGAPLEEMVLPKAKPAPVIFKIIIAGDSEVGASTLVSKFLGLKTKPDPHKGEQKLRRRLDYYTRSVNINNQEVVLRFHIYPNGLERHTNVGDSYLYGADAVLYLSDVTIAKTLDNISEHRENIKLCNQKNPQLVEVIALNKIDDEHGHVITVERFYKKAAEYGIENTAIISAKNGINTNKLLNEMVKAIYDTKPELEKKLVEEFKTKYFLQYRSEFFKNPWSKMKKLLEEDKFNSMDEIRKYAKEHPGSRTDKILKRFPK